MVAAGAIPARLGGPVAVAVVEPAAVDVVTLLAGEVCGRGTGWSHPRTESHTVRATRRPFEVVRSASMSAM